MPCYHPLKGVRGAVNPDTGKRPLLFDVKLVDSSSQLPTLVPCGQCVGCRLEYSRQWAMRCLDEAKMHKENSFITLTYDDAHIPVDRSLERRSSVGIDGKVKPEGAFQLFMKRLRKRLNKKVRFYHAGEYGERFGRPHYHALIFGHGFSDRQFLKRTGSGFNIYMSKELQSCWPFGYTSVGDVTFESAAYVARYVMKKITGDAAEAHYTTVNVDTGEISVRTPEFNKMSLKPGIGAGWFDKFHKDVFPRDYVVARGVESKPPRFYDKLLDRNFPDLVDDVKFSRYTKAMLRQDDETDERLAVREQCFGLCIFYQSF